MTTHAFIGRQFGNYVAEGVIGEGGMGVVLRARHVVLDEKVAVKVLTGRHASNAEVQRRFRQEAIAARDIGDPSIIDVRDCGSTSDGEHYLVMELLDGETLAARLSRGRFTEATACQLGAMIADCLGAAHRHGIVHRDLKPDNIFLARRAPRDPREHRAIVLGGEERILKILDFGIAKVLGAADLTSTGSVIGTAAYMAPEQGRSSRAVDEKADIYALGVILFEMGTGRRPFGGDGPLEVLVRAAFDPPPPPSSIAPVSPAFESLILHCLEKRPEARPSSMDEVRDRLSAGRAGPRSVTTTLSEGASELAPRSRPEATARPQPVAPPRVLVGGLLVLTAVLLTTVGYLFARLHQAPGPSESSHPVAVAASNPAQVSASVAAPREPPATPIAPKPVPEQAPSPREKIAPLSTTRPSSRRPARAPPPEAERAPPAAEPAKAKADAGALLAEARTFYEAGRYVPAQKKAREVANRTGAVEAWTLVGWSSCKSGDRAAAQEAWTRVSGSLNPRERELLEAECERANITLHPSTRERLHALVTALLSHAEAAMSSGDHPGAIRTAKQITTMDARNSRAWQIIAESSCEVRDGTTATEALTHLSPDVAGRLRYLCRRLGVSIHD